jgi:hypothetical protein
LIERVAVFFIQRKPQSKLKSRYVRSQITSLENRGWPGDVVVSGLKTSGLPVASLVRTTKIATMEAKESVRIGILPTDDRAAIARHLRTALAGALKTHR